MSRFSTDFPIHANSNDQEADSIAVYVIRAANNLRAKKRGGRLLITRHFFSMLLEDLEKRGAPPGDLQLLRDYIKTLV